LAKKSPITRLVWQTDQRCLHLMGGFRGRPIEWNHTKCCLADPCCHGNENLANLGYFFTKIDSSFLFVDGIEPFLGRQFSMWHSTKRCSSIFDFGPPNAKNLLPKICNCTKSPITRLVWQIDRRCLRLLGGFRGWPIQWNHAKCCGADPCCHGNEILANLGYFSTKSPMSRLVCQIDQICLGLPAETTSGADLCCQGNDIWDRRGV